MAPIIHLVRHAQGFHNIAEDGGKDLRDPLLTDLGKNQCRQLKQNFPPYDRVELVVASPIKRTMYTALISFEDQISRRRIKVIGLPSLQAAADTLSDTGSSLEELAQEFEGHEVDWNHCPKGWYRKEGQWACTNDAVEARAREARQWLKNRPEAEIAVVTHRGMMPYLVEGWSENDRISSKDWSNTEYHTCEFDELSGDQALLSETADSRSRRLQRASELHQLGV